MLKWSFSEEAFEAGFDEAGRGCLAGPVTAAGVILPQITKELLKKNAKLDLLVSEVFLYLYLLQKIQYYQGLQQQLQ